MSLPLEIAIIGLANVIIAAAAGLRGVRVGSKFQAKDLDARARREVARENLGQLEAIHNASLKLTALVAAAKRGIEQQVFTAEAGWKQVGTNLRSGLDDEFSPLVVHQMTLGVQVVHRSAREVAMDMAVRAAAMLIYIPRADDDDAEQARKLSLFEANEALLIKQWQYLVRVLGAVARGDEDAEELSWPQPEIPPELAEEQESS